MENRSLFNLFDAKSSEQMNWAMRISFFAGIVLLVLKLYAYSITGSSAILSDCSESVIHVFAVGFATFSMWLSLQPADKKHQYGHDKIGFFSAGFEGAMIIIAAFYIVYESLIKLIYGCEVANLIQGISFICMATCINGILGTWLIFQGKRYNSLILKANGRHVLTDCVTSLCVVIGLIVVKLTQIVWFDPLIALGAAIHILISGTKLVTESIEGLMDSSDTELDLQIQILLDAFTEKRGISYHQLRHRKAGSLVFLELHLLFQDDISILSAHDIATELEANLKAKMGIPLDITTHLEPKEQHDIVHQKFLRKID
ncbi:MAG: cation diffusion facilitator family transporter [Chlamydia sp.]